MLTLVNMSHKDYPPRRGRTGAQWAEERRLAFDALHQHFEARRHQRALEIMAGAMRSVTPFGLCLKNFALGPRVYPARDNASGLPQVTTLVSAEFDQEMQRPIAAVLAPRVPTVCISNPAEALLMLPRPLHEG